MKRKLGLSSQIIYTFAKFFLAWLMPICLYNTMLLSLCWNFFIIVDLSKFNKWNKRKLEIQMKIQRKHGVYKFKRGRLGPYLHSISYLWYFCVFWNCIDCFWNCIDCSYVSTAPDWTFKYWIGGVILF